MDDSSAKDEVIRELADALQAALPLITAAANNRRAGPQSRIHSARLRAQIVAALVNAGPLSIPEPHPLRETPDDG
jgi:hypothetical protein